MVPIQARLSLYLDPCMQGIPALTLRKPLISCSQLRRGRKKKLLTTAIAPPPSIGALGKLSDSRALLKFLVPSMKRRGVFKILVIRRHLADVLISSEIR